MTYAVTVMPYDPNAAVRMGNGWICSSKAAAQGMMQAYINQKVESEGYRCVTDDHDDSRAYLYGENPDDLSAVVLEVRVVPLPLLSMEPAPATAHLN